MTNATPNSTDTLATDSSAPESTSADAEAPGELIDRISREQDDVIAQLDELLLRIDQVLQVTLAEIKSESAQSMGLTSLDGGESTLTLEFSALESNQAHDRSNPETGRRTASKAA